MNILGLNAYHGDSAACLVKDGKLVAAAEEERFRRIKHWAGFPSEAILYCLRESGLSLEEIDMIAMNSDPRANLLRKFFYTLWKRPGISFLFNRILNWRRRIFVRQTSKESFFIEKFKGRVFFIEHHRAHLASCFFASPFQKAVTVSVDGFGDFASAAWGTGEGTHLRVDGKVYFPHSLGIFYEALTQYLGFLNYGDEYKVMGLAPYGEPNYLNEMKRIVRLKADGTFELNLDFFRHAREGVEYKWEGGIPFVGKLFSPSLETLLGPARQPQEEITQHHKDIARSTQVMYEEAFFHLLNALHKRYRLDHLTLAGGCAMNSVANGKIYQRTPFKKVYIQAAAGDAGGAIGAAFALWHQLKPRSPRFLIDHACWGEAFDDTLVEQCLASARGELEKQNCGVEFVDDDEVLCRRAAKAVEEGKVVGWFQGRMEWGPRALGNRSIVCDPRRSDMKDILNLKIKRRESFRPFAPSILREKTGEWFEIDEDVPFMSQVFQVRSEKRSQIPAVTHVDGSGRLQTVSVTANPLYHRLIKCFEDLTGIPMVLNTSFNENEPIVCKPEEALDCFLRTQMDVLVLGHFFIERKHAVKRSAGLMALKVTIITVVRNGQSEIAGCIESVLAQTYKPIEYIVIDGASTDGTLEIVRRYQDRIATIVSEKDEGPYGAMNKGLKLATGDVVGFLHADDLYAGPDVIENVVKKMTETGADSLYGDLAYVRRQQADRLVRYWRSGDCKKDSFRCGWMPPHPAFFVKRTVYEKYGGFDTSFRIAADYELMLRFLCREKVSMAYLPKTLVRMRWGGLSNRSLPNLLKKSFEDYRACRRYGLGIGTVLAKNFTKLFQFVQRPRAA